MGAQWNNRTKSQTFGQCFVTRARLTYNERRMPSPFPCLQPHELPYVFPVKTPAVVEHAPNEGELALDVVETTDAFLVTTPIAGVGPHDLDVSVTHDLLTIRGERKSPYGTLTMGTSLISQECHWGRFSRTVVLPGTVKTDEVGAELKNGVLTIRLPKNPNAGQVTIKTFDS